MEPTVNPNTHLTDARLIVTGHASDGTSIFTHDEIRAPFAPLGPAMTHFTYFHSSPTVPASNMAPFPEFTSSVPRCPPRGMLFCIADFLPGSRVPMHRTESVDYAVVLEGEIVLALDNGEERVVRRGEFVVQRGANHAWINRAEHQACRIVFMSAGTDKIVLEDGRVLEQTKFGPPPKMPS